MLDVIVKLGLARQARFCIKLRLHSAIGKDALRNNGKFRNSVNDDVRSEDGAQALCVRRFGKHVFCHPVGIDHGNMRILRQESGHRAFSGAHLPCEAVGSPVHRPSLSMFRLCLA